MEEERRDPVVAQRLAALERANEFRVRRAVLKREIAAGRWSARVTLLAVPAWAEGMPVIELLLAVPKVGRVKALRMLSGVGVAPSRRLGELTAARRECLVGLLGGGR